MKEETNAEIVYRFLGELAIVIAVAICACFTKMVGG